MIDGSHCYLIAHSSNGTTTLANCLPCGAAKNPYVTNTADCSDHTFGVMSNVRSSAADRE